MALAHLNSPSLPSEGSKSLEPSLYGSLCLGLSLHVSLCLSISVSLSLHLSQSVSPLPDTYFPLESDGFQFLVNISFV